MLRQNYPSSVAEIAVRRGEVNGELEVEAAEVGMEEDLEMEVEGRN